MNYRLRQALGPYRLERAKRRGGPSQRCDGNASTSAWFDAGGARKFTTEEAWQYYAERFAEDYPERYAELTRPRSRKQGAKKPELNRRRGWKAVRYEILKAAGGRCALCGRGAPDGVRLELDHIKPKSTHPELAKAPDNLQVLCSDCNAGKKDRDTTDWR